MAKLVRDKIPEIIIRDGGNPKSRFADDEEFWQKLKEKLVEETNEFVESENEEELADIYEVLDAIINFDFGANCRDNSKSLENSRSEFSAQKLDFKKFDKAKINEIKRKKFKERGGFDKRIILE
ncbi:nucleoside triphosphate pyrophosphohydrolase [Candidatus Pacearchaeota archaeon]|nr:nucleoside triphosphate pyrophosphohydrolase [Candidatus Pacearchaeota archaeon]